MPNGTPAAHRIHGMSSQWRTAAATDATGTVASHSWQLTNIEMRMVRSFGRCCQTALASKHNSGREATGHDTTKRKGQDDASIRKREEDLRML